MRTLTNHEVNPANTQLTIGVADAPGSGGAHHRYEIVGLDQSRNKSVSINDRGDPRRVLVIFQNGPILENGVNGVTHEVLLAIIEDRLACFQSGPYACSDNAEALAHIQAAQEALQRRTRARMARGVEGTHTV